MASSARRPLVVVEDHLYHIDRLLTLFDERDASLLPRLTVVCLDRPGPDTQAALERWSRDYPQVQVMADAEPISDAALPRLPAEVLRSGHHYARTVAELLAPRGLLLQDIQLETLRYVPVDQWWETIYLANTIRGMYAERPPSCIFVSNKRGFHATFGKDLLSVDFDPRDVLHKDELDQVLVPLLRRRLFDAFPLELRVAGEARPRWITRDAAEAEQLATELDLIAWEDRPTKMGLTGRCIAGKRGRVELAASAQEAVSWRALVRVRMDEEVGIPTRAVGERVAPQLALAAEQSNAAARHIYALRRRLRDPESLLTVEHHYRLSDELAVGWVVPRSRGPAPG